MNSSFETPEDIDSDSSEWFEEETWAVDEEKAGERIDRLLADFYPELSRTQAQQWIEEGAITVNDKPSKSNYKVKSGDVIGVIPPEPEQTHVEPENIPLNIVYEDADVIVVNKPRGMVVHPAAGHMHGTLVNALLHHCNDLSGIGGVMRPGIVHRIDKDTSGLIMAAKNDHAHRSLSDQLRQHTATRKYLGLVHGVVNHDLGTVDAPIGRHPVHRKLMAVKKDGKAAVTHFSVLERFGNYTLIECKLETGRTHQIRVHMDFIGHPLVGDPVYGQKKTLQIDGQALHAQVLGFVHPRTGEHLEFTTDVPADMQILIDQLRADM